MILPNSSSMASYRVGLRAFKWAQLPGGAPPISLRFRRSDPDARLLTDLELLAIPPSLPNSLAFYVWVPTAVLLRDRFYSR